MATYTSYLNLEKPATSENFNLAKINSNWDKIDTGCSNLNTKVTTFSAKNNDEMIAGSKFTLGSSRMQRIGNVLHIAITATSTAAYGSSDIIATLPASHIPMRDTIAMLVLLKRGTEIFTYTATGILNTSGQVTETFTASGGQSGDRLTLLFLGQVE